MATKLVKTFTTSTHWDVRYDVNAGTGIARHQSGGRRATFTVQPGEIEDLVVFIGHLPPYHVVQEVQRLIRVMKRAKP
jgi:hypothetical protein